MQLPCPPRVEMLAQDTPEEMYLGDFLDYDQYTPVFSVRACELLASFFTDEIEPVPVLVERPVSRDRRTGKPLDINTFPSWIPYYAINVMTDLDAVDLDQSEYNVNEVTNSITWFYKLAIKGDLVRGPGQSHVEALSFSMIL